MNPLRPGHLPSSGGYLALDGDQLHVQLAQHRGGRGGVGRHGLHIFLGEEHSFRRFPLGSVLGLGAMLLLLDLRDCLSRGRLHDTQIWMNVIPKNLECQMDSNHVFPHHGSKQPMTHTRLHRHCTSRPNREAGRDSAAGLCLDAWRGPTPCHSEALTAAPQRPAVTGGHLRCAAHRG